MKRFGVSAITGTIFLVAAFILVALAVETTPEAILKNPEKFDGAAVTLSGTVTNLRSTVSRKGNPYYTFDLAAGGQSVRIFSFGAAPAPTGPAPRWRGGSPGSSASPAGLSTTR